MRNPFLNLILVAINSTQNANSYLLNIKRDLHGQQDSERSDGFKGGGGIRKHLNLGFTTF